MPATFDSIVLKAAVALLFFEFLALSATPISEKKCDECGGVIARESSADLKIFGAESATHVKEFFKINLIH